MSLKQPMALEVAQIRADAIRQTLLPFCDKVDIAGSIRRGKAEVGDIELVVLPKVELKRTGLAAFLSLSDSTKEVSLLDEIILMLTTRGDCKLGKNGPKYKELIYAKKGFKVDLFIANPQNFGVIKMIRTGSADYSKQFMIELNKQAVYNIAGGYLWRQDKRIAIASEEELFQQVGFPWRDPENRVKEIF